MCGGALGGRGRRGLRRGGRAIMMGRGKGHVGGNAGAARRLRIAGAAALAALLVLLVGYGLVKAKVVQVNPLFVRECVTGVDVSNHQAEVDMAALSGQGVQFVYIKATEGTSYVDDYFDENWAAAKAAGVPCGAYHFFSFDTPGAGQAENFISTVGPLDGCLVPVVDVEWYGDKERRRPFKADVVRELSAFLDALEAEYGVKPMLYAQGVLYDEYLADDFADYPRWVRSVYFPIGLYLDDDAWTLWQYSDSGRLEGSTGHEENFDLNALNPGTTLEQLTVGS